MVTIAQRDTLRLWSTWTILGCTIFFSVPAGLLLALINYGTMDTVVGRFNSKINLYLYATIFGTIAYAVLANVLPNIGLGWLPILLNIVIGLLIKQDLDKEMARFEQVDARAAIEIASVWTAIGVAFLLSLVLAGLFLMIGALGL